MTSFEEKVLEAVRRIPKGKVTTYKRIAAAIGKPNASRAVGAALRKNPQLEIIPCHRVVKSNGELGGYAAGVFAKKKILLREGVLIKKDKVDARFFI
jgi:O-6-methylguanine DNA methyltransferase